MFCFHAKGLLCPPALALLGGWPAPGARSQKSSQWGFPLSSTGCNGRFLLRIRGSPYGGANPRTPAFSLPSLVPRCWHRPRLGSDPGDRCSKQQERCAWGKMSSPLPLCSVRCSQEFVSSPSALALGKGGFGEGSKPLGCVPQRSLAFLQSPGTRVSPKIAPGLH